MTFVAQPIIQKSAFGELAVAEPTPTLQELAVFGISNAMNLTKSGTGSEAKSEGSLFHLESGTDVGGFSFVGSQKYLNYRSGQGLLFRFTAKFGAPAAGNRQLAGGITAANAICFGYNDTNQKFGILHRHGGVNESRILTIATASGSSGTVTVEVDGIGYPVELPGTSSKEADAKAIADELNASAFLFQFDQVGDTVVMTALRSRPYVTAFTFTDTDTTGCAASWAVNAAGVAPTDTWYYMDDGAGGTEWNMTTAARLATLNPQKGNVYQIRAQYLGFGAITLSLENPETGEFDPVHRIKYANANDVPSFTNPAFRIGWSCSNITGNSNVTLQGASIAAYVEGEINNTRPSHTESRNVNSSQTETYIMTLKSGNQFGNYLNTVLSQIKDLIVVNSESRSAFLRVYKNATLTGANFSQAHDGDTPLLVDKSATGFTDGELLQTYGIARQSSLPLDVSKDNLTLIEGETLTFTCQLVGAAGDDFTLTVKWQDDY